MVGAMPSEPGQPAGWNRARELAAEVARVRAAFEEGLTRPLAWREEQLHALRRMLLERGAEFEAALASDLGKHPTESQLTEIAFVAGEAEHTLRHLRRWLRPAKVPVPLVLRPGDASVVRDPLGVVLVLAPWNYPLQLVLAPAVGALACGNAVVLKPSEHAPATSAALARLVPEYLDARAVAVVEGGPEDASALLEQRFDHIFFTGGDRVGRLVARAAAEHLTPVTLELGGKSPAYVDATTDLPTAARRIAWGKFLNAGQTCVAPDYVLAPPDVAARLEPLLIDAVTALYGQDPASSADYGRIVDEAHLDRLAGLLSSGRIVTGGQVDREQRYLAPTVLADVDPDSPVMQEEVFGPVLPVVEVADLDAAIDFVNARPKPLVLYAFTGSPEVRDRLVTETSSGAVGFGVPGVHASVPGLPFGGVGGSGTGSYHGEHSIAIFSHAKAVLDKGDVGDTLRLIQPPYGRLKGVLARRLLHRLRAGRFRVPAPPRPRVAGPAAARARCRETPPDGGGPR